MSKAAKEEVALVPLMMTTSVLVSLGDASYRIGTVVANRITKRLMGTEIQSYVEYQVAYDNITHPEWYAASALITDITHIAPLRAFIPKQ